MRESIRRIQRDGYSEPLRELVKKWSIQKSSVEFMKSRSENVYFSFPNHTDLCWCYEGIMEQSATVLTMVSLNRVIEVNVKSRELLRVNGEDVSGIEHAKVLDLNDDGERWEGDVLNDQPYGWGVVYDSENRMVYEGFRFKDVNVCYGTRYYSDVGVIEYEGEWLEGKRWGRGKQYDRRGKTVFEGEWMNDGHLEKKIVMNKTSQFLHNHIEDLIVTNKCCNGREWILLDFSILIDLRVLQVGNECFENVKEVKLIGLNRLERVVIGKNSFTKWRNEGPESIDPDRHFNLKNCERLRELKIGCFSFSDYTVCEIDSLPSLEVIEMGKLNEWSENFSFASLELKSDSQRMK